MYLSKTVLFQAIQFSISHVFVPLDRTLSDATTPGKSGPGSDGNEGVTRISQSSSRTGATTIKLYNVVSRTLVAGVYPLFRVAVGALYSPNRLGQLMMGSEE